MEAVSITAEKAVRRSVETEKLNNGFMSPEASMTDTADQLIDKLSRV